MAGFREKAQAHSIGAHGRRINIFLTEILFSAPGLTTALTNIKYLVSKLRPYFAARRRQGGRGGNFTQPGGIPTHGVGGEKPRPCLVGG